MDIYDDKEFSIIEVLPCKIDENKVLMNKMLLLITNLKSIPQDKGLCNIIFDITNQDDGLRTFRIIVSKDYQDDIFKILLANFPDFSIKCVKTVNENSFFDSYKGFSVFRSNEDRPLVRDIAYDEERMFENIKTLVNSVRKGSFQIILKFGKSFSTLVDEKDLEMVEISKTQDSKINYNKDIEVVFRFLSFDEDFNASSLPSAVGGILNMGGKFNVLTKILRNGIYESKSFGGKNVIKNIIHRMFHGEDQRLSYFSDADSIFLSAREISYLYCFLYASNVKTLPYKMGNPRKILAKQKELESIYSSNEFTNVALIDHPSCEEKTYFKVDNKTRLKHTYIIGKTGSGKTTVMLNLMKNDIESGKSFALFDPHGDLSNELLNLVPDFRQKDIVYIDPSHPLGFGNINLSVFSFLREIQECQKIEEDFLYKSQTGGVAKMNHTDALMSMIVTILKDVSIGGKEHWGSRMEALLMNIGSELFKYNLSEISDFSAFLNNASFRKTIISQMEDSVGEEFKNLEARGEKIRDEYFQPLKSRFRIFMSKSMGKIFSGTPKMKLRDMMDTGKILIFRLPNGHLGEEANILGSIMIGLFWAMAQSRISTEEKNRGVFTLYIDEVQKFMTSSFCSILEESRKYGLNLVMANQFLKQISDKKPEVYNSIHGNVGTFISFGVGIEDGERLSKKFGLNAIDMVNIPPYHAYVRCEPCSDETFSIKTEVVEQNPAYTYPGKDSIIRQSYLKYGIDTQNTEKIKHFSECKRIIYKYLVYNPTGSYKDFVFEFDYNKTAIDQLLEILQQSKIIQISDNKYSANMEMVNEYLNRKDNWMEVFEFDYISTETVLKDSISLKGYYDRYGCLPEYNYTKENYRYELLANEDREGPPTNTDPNIIIGENEI